MSTATARLDTPSLTLPDWRTALKRRIKRPKLPDRLLLIRVAFGLALTALEVWLATVGAGIGALVIAAGIFIDTVPSIRAIVRGQPGYPRGSLDRTCTRTFYALWAFGSVLVVVGIGT